MREIEYKAKSKITGKWLTGLLAIHQKEVSTFVIMASGKPKFIPVHTDTICQYTGMRDKNRTKLYENDYMTKENYPMRIIKFIDGGFRAVPTEGVQAANWTAAELGGMVVNGFVMSGNKCEVDHGDASMINRSDHHV